MIRTRIPLKWIAAGCLAVAGGCQTGASSKPAEPVASVRGDVTDIHPMEAITPAAYSPVPSQPVTYQNSAAQPASYETPAAASPLISTTPTPPAGKHVVRHGETLYGIARQSYGDGKQWTKIASANPGVSPSGLKVGQTLTIP